LAAIRKRKKGSSKIMGWLTKEKQYVRDVHKEIKSDEDSNICEKWENMYKKICQAAKVVGQLLQCFPPSLTTKYYDGAIVTPACAGRGES